MGLSCGVEMKPRILLCFKQKFQHHNLDNVLFCSVPRLTKKSRLPNLVIIYIYIFLHRRGSTQQYQHGDRPPIGRIEGGRLEELKAADWTGGRGVGGSSCDFVVTASVRIGWSWYSVRFGRR